MGIDAMMYVKVNRKFTEEERKRWSYVFGSAFHNHLMLGFDDKIYNRPLEDKRESYEDYLPENSLKIPLIGRYYGPEYERGPLMTYISIAEFLERMIPGCEIYYGGDSSGVEFELFDKQKRDEYLDHFIKVARDPYIRSFSQNGPHPTCPICEVEMPQNGYGMNYSLHTCSGCGWMIRKKDEIIENGFDLGLI